ncbi:MAG: hypothetical protein ACI4XL_05775 [Bacillus sp. (in: firmicutes)]
MIKQILAFERIEDYENHKEDIKQLNIKWDRYESMLKDRFELQELPKAIVWTSTENATTVFSTVPVPAYTNKDIIYMTPSVKEWRTFFLSQLEGHNISLLKEYFSSITIDHVFCVLAHELTHHIEWFVDDFDSERNDSIWFEEGMCEYLAHRLTLTTEQFTEYTAINEKMILLFKPVYGKFGNENQLIGSGRCETLAGLADRVRPRKRLP